MVALSKSSQLALFSCSVPTASLELASGDESGSKLHPSALVHHEHGHGGSPGRGKSDDQGGPKLEVLMPRLVPRVKETLDVSSLGVNPREIRPLEGVASLTSNAQAFGVI